MGMLFYFCVCWFSIRYIWLYSKTCIKWIARDRRFCFIISVIRFYLSSLQHVIYSHKEWKSLCCKHIFILNLYAITMYYCIYITYNSNFFCSVCQSILLSGTFPVQCRPIWNACLHPHKSCCIPSPDLETLGQQQWEGTNGHAGQIYM